MAVTKIVSYTEDQTTQLLQLHAEGVQPAEIAEKLGKSERSVISKLVYEGVYTSKEPQFPKRMKKVEMIALIAETLDIPVGKLESLEKGSHEALTLLKEALIMCSCHNSGEGAKTSTGSESQTDLQ